MGESAIVGIFTLLGVFLGTGLTYKILERLRKQERKDRILENTTDALIELSYALKSLQEFVKTPALHEDHYIKREVGTEFKRASKDLRKCCYKAEQYIKGPTIKLLNAFKKQMREFDNFIEKTNCLNKLGDDRIKNQLDDQIEKLINVTVRVLNSPQFKRPTIKGSNDVMAQDRTTNFLTIGLVIFLSVFLAAILTNPCFFGRPNKLFPLKTKFLP